MRVMLSRKEELTVGGTTDKISLSIDCVNTTGPERSSSSSGLPAVCVDPPSCPSPVEFATPPAPARPNLCSMAPKRSKRKLRS